jgi:hypothetical protein
MIPNTIFRFLGDLNQFLITIALIHHIYARKSSSGLSYKSQWLYASAFLARYAGHTSYLPVWSWSRPVCFYNTCVMLFSIIGSLYIIYLMVWRFKPTRDGTDTIKLLYLLPAVFLAGFFLNDDFSPFYLTASLKYNVHFYFPSVYPFSS